MKLTSLIILLSLLSLKAQAQKETVAQHKHISILSTSNEVFYFKADADFIGGKVEVTDSTGSILFTAELHSKRNLIDFFYLKNGQYTIHFEHNGAIEDYQVWLDKKEGHLSSSFAVFKLKA
jgi:hypothetical protein